MPAISNSGIAERAVACLNDDDLDGSAHYEGDLYERYAGATSEAKELLQEAGMPEALMHFAFRRLKEGEQAAALRAYDRLARQFGEMEASSLAEAHDFPLAELRRSNIEAGSTSVLAVSAAAPSDPLAGFCGSFRTLADQGRLQRSTF